MCAWRRAERARRAAIRMLSAMLLPCPTLTHSRVADEIADVLIYLLHLADTVGIDPVSAAANKLVRNLTRIPVTSLVQSVRPAPLDRV